MIKALLFSFPVIFKLLFDFRKFSIKSNLFMDEVLKRLKPLIIKMAFITCENGKLKRSPT
jgi:hypothetical protein